MTDDAGADPRVPVDDAVVDAELPDGVVAALRSGEVDVHQVVRRLQDMHELSNPDLATSLEQIRRGEFTVVRRRPDC